MRAEWVHPTLLLGALVAKRVMRGVRRFLTRNRGVSGGGVAVEGDGDVEGGAFAELAVAPGAAAMPFGNRLYQ